MRAILILLGVTACGFDGVPVTDGQPIAPTLVVSPGAVDFGIVAVGSASPMTTFTVTNHGASADSTAAVATSLTGASFAVLADTCAGTMVAAGASCTISVAFLPVADGAASETLGVAAMPGGTATIALTGTGADAGTISATPMTPLAFGNVISGESMVMSVAIANPAGAAATAPIFVVPPAAPFSVLVGAIGAGNDCGSAVTSLAGGESCTIRVQYAPVGTRTTAQAATLQIIQGAQLDTVSLTGTPVTPISIGPTPFAFGNVDQGSAPTNDFTVTNNSVNPVAITSSALTGATGMSIAATTCTAPLATAGTCTITVAFQPTSSFTDTGAKLQVNSANGSATATITGHGNLLDNVVFTQTFAAPARFDFGSTIAGTSAGSQTFTLKNTGESASAIVTPSLTNTTDFSIGATTCGAALAGGASCTVTVQFKPPGTSLGLRTGSIIAAAANNQIDISGQSLAVGSLLLTEPDPTAAVTDFGASVLGTATATQTFSLRNTAIGTPVAIAASFDDPEFAVTGGTCTGALASNTTCTIIATFTPATRGDRPGKLQITGGGNPYSRVTGNGQSPAAIALPPASAGCVLGAGTCTFPATGAGTTSTVTFTLANTGDVATGTITTTALAGANPTQFTLANGCTTLAAGATCKLTASFKPTAGTTGVQTATFTMAAAPGLATQTVTLSGNAVAAGTLAITPTDPQVATAAVAGSLDTTGTPFTITNQGGVPTGNLALSIGADTSDFKLVTGTCPVGGPLGPGVSCVATVYFNPLTVAQNLTTTLTVTATPGGTVTGSLMGSGLSAIAAAQPTVDLGSVAAGQAGTAGAVMFTNTGDVASGVLDVQLAGPDAAAMSVVSDGCVAKPLGPHASCTIDVRFVPARAGAQTATLTASTTQGSATVMVTGTGL